jgi:hypothetical protein
MSNDTIRKGRVCDHCEWFVDSGECVDDKNGATLGHCFRYPPVFVGIEEDCYVYERPETCSDDFCGEFKEDDYDYDYSEV